MIMTGAEIGMHANAYFFLYNYALELRCSLIKNLYRYVSHNNIVLCLNYFFAYSSRKHNNDNLLNFSIKICIHHEYLIEYS